MKKFFLFLLTLATIVGVVGTLITKKRTDDMAQQKELDSYLITQKPRIEKYLKYNYNNVYSVELEKVSQTPMGGIYIDGTVNKTISFSARVEETGVEYVDGFIEEDLGIKEIDGNTKSVSEILKEEQKAKYNNMFD